MSITTWLALALICVLGAMSPGPSLALIVRTTLSASRRHGIAAAVAHGSGVGLYALASILGLSLVVKTHAALYQAITWAGALYLIWMGIKGLRAGASIFNAATAGPRMTMAQAARDGLAISMLNPKLAIFFIALFSQFVRPEVTGLGRAAMVATAACIDAGWYSLVALLISQSGILAWLQQRLRWLNRVMALILIALGLQAGSITCCLCLCQGLPWQRHSQVAPKNTSKPKRGSNPASPECLHLSG